MRFTYLIVITTIVMALGLSIAQQFPNANATDNVVVADADKVYAMSYRLTDLPVWSQDGKTFNPAILMAYLKASLYADWDASAQMAPSKSSLVIVTTSTNHDRIAELLRDLRKAARAPDAE